jgi:hypothetical protein
MSQISQAKTPHFSATRILEDNFILSVFRIEIECIPVERVVIVFVLHQIIMRHKRMDADARKRMEENKAAAHKRLRKKKEEKEAQTKGTLESG